jgi:hypothetical protein
MQTLPIAKAVYTAPPKVLPPGAHSRGYFWPGLKSHAFHVHALLLIKSLGNFSLGCARGHQTPSPPENMSSKFGNLRMRPIGSVIRSAASPRGTCPWALKMLGLPVAPPRTIIPAYGLLCVKVGTLYWPSSERSKASGTALNPSKPKTSMPPQSMEVAKAPITRQQNQGQQPPNAQPE